MTQIIKPFQFAALPRIYFRCGKIKDLPSLAGAYNGLLLLITGKHSFIESDQGRSLMNDLNELRIPFKHFIVASEPSVDLIDNAVSLFNQEKISAVVSIGGGSVIDAGKAISAMLGRFESIAAYLEGVGTKQHPGQKLPFIAVPTTSGTGSEATKNAVITGRGEKGFKRSLRHENFVPDIAVVDPELSLSCPAAITAASGMDCFSQLLESFLSDKACKYSDALALEGLKSVKTSLEDAFSNGLDLKARTGMSFAALTSGICLANAGLGVVHGFASSIGGMYEIAHGLICGTLMSAANEKTVKRLRENNDNPVALVKYTTLGKIFLDEKGRSDSWYIDGFIDYLKRMTETLRLPGLKESGIELSSIEDICSVTDCKNNPVKLDKEDLMEILYNSFD
jgi:alcohol dehydrogenase class IV